jgi:hypothetical protein
MMRVLDNGRDGTGQFFCKFGHSEEIAAAEAKEKTEIKQP